MRCTAMSNRAWDARRLNQRIKFAQKIWETDPDRVVPMGRGVVAVSPARWFDLTHLQREWAELQERTDR